MIVKIIEGGFEPWVVFFLTLEQDKWFMLIGGHWIHFLKQTLKAEFKAVSEVLLWLLYLSLIKNIFLSCWEKIGFLFETI